MSDRLRILDALKYGPMNPAHVATVLDVPPFSVRGELKAMKRARLVEEHLTSERHVFELTTRGREVLDNAQQLQIHVPVSTPRSPLSEPCLRCGAPAGEPCRTDTGDRANREHLSRRRLATYVPIGRVS